MNIMTFDLERGFSRRVVLQGGSLLTTAMLVPGVAFADAPARAAGAATDIAVKSVRFKNGVIDINNAGLMLLGPIVGADTAEWERMLEVNVRGLLYMTHAAIPHLLSAAESGSRKVADVVNISSIAGRQAWAISGSTISPSLG